MDIVIPHPNDTPYSDGDLAAIIAAPGIGVLPGKEAELRKRLQRIVAIETELQGAVIEDRDGDDVLVGSQRTTEGRVGRPKGSGNLTRELAELFRNNYRPRLDRPFCQFYREASQRLIDSTYVRDKGFDLQYLLFTEKKGIPAELTDATILRNARQKSK